MKITGREGQLAVIVRAVQRPSLSGPAHLPAGRRLIRSGALLAFAAAAPATLAAVNGQGELIAVSRGADVSTAAVGFHRSPPPGAFRLEATDRVGVRLNINWSITCVSPGGRQRGGASGRATLARGRWVKRVSANWIRRPSACAGSVRASAAGGPVRIRVYTG